MGEQAARLKEFRSSCDGAIQDGGSTLTMDVCDVRWLTAVVERLEAQKLQHLDLAVAAKAAGREQAAKIAKPPYPDHESDAGYVSGWNEGIHAFRAAIRAEKERDDD